MRHVDIDGPEFGSFCSGIISVFKSESLDKALLRILKKSGFRLGCLYENQITHIAFVGLAVAVAVTV